MSLDNPTKIERLVAKFTSFPMAVRAGIVLGIVLLGVLLLLWLAQWFGGWRTERGLKKDREKIANTVAEISNVNAQIGELNQKKAELQGELNRDVEDMKGKVFGLDETKKEVNAAQANFNAALKANSNIDVTAQDFIKKLEELDKQ